MEFAAAGPSPARNRVRRRADPHRLDVQSGRRAGMGVGRPARAPCASGAGRRRRCRPGAALRAGVHPSGAALDHVPHRAVPGRLRTPGMSATRCRRDGRSPRCCPCSIPLPHRGWRTGTRTGGRAPAHRREGAPLAHAGDSVRPRPAFLSGTTVFAVRDDGRDDALVRPLPDDTGLDDAPAAGPGPDRWRGTGGRTVPPRLRCSATRRRHTSHFCTAIWGHTSCRKRWRM